MLNIGGDVGSAVESARCAASSGITAVKHTTTARSADTPFLTALLLPALVIGLSPLHFRLDCVRLAPAKFSHRETWSNEGLESD
jgi:hypothetical protein